MVARLKFIFLSYEEEESALLTSLTSLAVPSFSNSSSLFLTVPQWSERWALSFLLPFFFFFFE